MAGQAVAQDDWVDDGEWVDEQPGAKPSGKRKDLDAALKSMGLSDADLAALDKFDRDQPDNETTLATAGSLGGPVGSGVGGAVGTLMDGGSITDSAISGAKNFAIPKAMERGIEALRQPVTNLLRRGAVRAMKAAVKPDRGYLEKMAGAKRGGIAKMETEIAETALDEGINPVRRSGMDKLQGKIESTAKARTSRIARAPNEPISGSANNADAAAVRSLRKLSRGDAAQDDIAAAEKFIDDMRTSPQTTAVKSQDVSFVDEVSPISGPRGETISRLRAKPGLERRGLTDLTPSEQADVIEAGNDRLRGLFGGQSKNAEIQSRLAVQRARTADLDKAAGTKKLSSRMRKLIDLRNVGNIATRRAESNNPISLTDVISFSAGRPAVAAGSVGMKAPVLADIARALNGTSRYASVPATPEIKQLRRILLAMMGTAGDTK